MTAHLNLPHSILPVTGHLRCRGYINGLLKEKLGFKGLVITDAMNMKEWQIFQHRWSWSYGLPGSNDVIEFVTDPELQSMKSAIHCFKKISQQELILNAGNSALKYGRIGKSARCWKSTISQKINSGDAKALIIDLYANALTLLRNEGNVIP